MSKDVLVKEGTVLESLPNTTFKIQLDPEEGEEEGRIILAMVSGKMRRYYIKILPGDRIKVEIPTVDLNRGRIVYRFK